MLNRKQNMEKKNILILMLSFATLVIAGSIFYFQKGAVNAPFVVGQKPPVETVSPLAPKGWKTYTNKEFGFAFDYPEGYEVGQGVEFKTNYGRSRTVGLAALDKLPGDFLTPIGITEGLNFNERHEQIKDFLKRIGYEIIKKEPVDINGAGGIKLVAKNDKKYQMTIFLFTHPKRDKSTFEIEIFNEPYASKFIESFRFLP